MNQKIDISISTIFRFILIILGLYFVYLIRDVLIMVFISLIIAAAIDGPVDWLARHRVRRVFGTIIIYLLIFAVLTLSVYLIFPTLAEQLRILAVNLPVYLDKLGAGFSIVQQKIGESALQQILDNASGQLSGAASDVFGTAVNVFGGIFNAVIVFVISVYLVIQDKSLKDLLANILPERHQAYVINLAERIQSKLGAWVRGQILLMFIIGLLFFVGLFLLKVKFALTLALIGGLLEIIPFVGPILAGLIAAAISFSQSPFLALLVLILYVVIHQLEGNVIAPLVMRRIVGLNPLVVIISVVIGAKLAGILGVFMAVPIAATFSVLLKDFFALRSN